MKRFVACLAGLLALPAFAEIAPLYFEEVATAESVAAVPASDTNAETDVPAEKPVAADVPQTSRANPRGRVSSRNVPAVANRTAAATGRANPTARATRAGVVSRTATNTTPVRSATAVSARPSRNASARNQIATTRRAMQNGGARTARAGITTNDTVNNPIYTGNVVSRASVRTNSSGAVRARIPTISASIDNSSTSLISAAPVSTAASTTSAMDELAQITAFCKAQYTECMDNFCNVLDDNQGRCSCSKNIKNYEKTEAALKEATNALQDVAQQIQYIGLDADEIETLFTQTEAELVMSATSDNSQLKNDLDKIKGLLVDVKSGTASSTEIDSGLSMDLSGLMNFNISSDGFNLGALFGNTTATNTNSISNQRGEQLYKTAAARCKAAVLNDCASQGVDISVVSNSYDLEIDKQCVAYERSLTDANDEMNQTVRNAKNVLQRARLMVAQQKNAYDLRGCVNALDSCMQDDFVCGSDYENCLDPYGKYIVDGEVVVGSTPGLVVNNEQIGVSSGLGKLYETWVYGNNSSQINAWADTGSLSAYVVETLDGAMPTSIDTNMSKYLQHKIGYIQDGRTYGMCASVLNKCQDYTFQNGAYQPNNRVVEEYLMRTLVKIKSGQDRIISDYAESCIADVTSCLSENNYDVSSTTKANIAINACRAQVITCMSVNGDSSAEPNPTAMKLWAASVMGDSKMGISSVCNALGDNNCKVVTHIANFSNYTVTGTSCAGVDMHNPTSEDGKCKPSKASCEQIHATWEDDACVCYGYWGYQIQNPNPTLKDGTKYTGFMCLQQNV